MQVESSHRRILTDTFLIGALTALVKLAGASKTVVIARYFGAGDDLDAYLLAFAIPAFAGDVLAGGITQSLLPVLMQLKQSRDQRDAQRLCGAVLAGGAGLLLAVAVLVAVCAPAMLRLIASGFSAAKISTTQRLLLIMLPILPLSALNVTWRTLLYAEERFALAALAPVMTPLLTIAALVGLQAAWGVYSLAIGTLAGALMEVVVLAIALRARRIALFPRAEGVTPPTRRVLKQYLPVASSSLIMGGSSLIDQMMAAILGRGSVSALNYGTRLVGVILAIGPSALGTAILPRLSRLSVTGNWPEFRRTIKSFALLSVAATIPATAILAYLSEPLVRAFFQRGAFTAADTHLVSRVQAFSLLQIPFSVLLALLMRVVSSLQANHMLLNLALISLAANVLLDLILMRWYGVAGIALSTAAVHAIGLGVIARFVFRSTRGGILST